MNLAWNKNALKAGCKTYIQNTLNAFFGASTGKKSMPLMEEYYRLTSIRHSAYMAMPYGDTEFHSGEFGNEPERFRYRYDLLKAKTESIERMLPQNQKDGFFVSPTTATLWRGGMACSALKQLIADADWGELDYFCLLYTSYQLH